MRSAMVSRFRTACSISLIIRSCSTLSTCCRSCIRWISCSIAAISFVPASGSSASRVSFSSWIFFSQSMSCRSISMISSSTSALPAFAAWILISRSIDVCSSSLSSFTNSSCITPFVFSRSPSSFLFEAMSSFMRCLSLCRTSTRCFSRFTSAAWLISSFDSRCFCSARIALRACISELLSTLSSVSDTTSTRAVWSSSHFRWSSVHSSFVFSTSVLCLRIIISRGPIISASLSADPPAAFTSCSYLRLSRSTRYIFFSISSDRCRISSWYFSMSLSFSFRSSVCLSSTSFNCVLWASVLRMSTRMRLTS
mmetsp:Transcript_19218/g.26083  ORF Transcript_19218/g.26083 Transcript_19218/m.26083 type:complete len:310 (-) Transcript_19218:492-1421(-)